MTSLSCSRNDSSTAFLAHSLRDPLAARFLRDAQRAAVEELDRLGDRLSHFGVGGARRRDRRAVVPTRASMTF